VKPFEYFNWKEVPCKYWLQWLGLHQLTYVRPLLCNGVAEFMPAEGVAIELLV
jgi:hypothetical protein